MSRTKLSRTEQVVTIVIIAFAVRAFLGDEIGGFMDGMILGFTDGI